LLLLVLFTFCKDVTKNGVVLQRFDLMPLVSSEINWLSFFGHHQFLAFFTHNARTRMTDCCVCICVRVARQTLSFVGVVDVQYRTVVGKRMGWANLYHVCLFKPRTNHPSNNRTSYSARDRFYSVQHKRRKNQTRSNLLWWINFCMPVLNKQLAAFKVII